MYGIDNNPSDGSQRVVHSSDRDEKIKTILYLPIEPTAAAPKRNGRCARATDAHTCTRRGRAPVAERLAVSIFEFNRTSEAHAQRGALRWTERLPPLALPAPTCPPGPHHEEPDGAPKQNSRRTCRECSHCHRSRAGPCANRYGDT
ncbi:hypothetical protein ACJJTC_012051 [Scirpophaga incertulas]